MNKRAGTGAGSECGVRAQEAMGRKKKRDRGRGRLNIAEWVQHVGGDIV